MLDMKQLLIQELRCGTEYWHFTPHENFVRIARDGEVRAMPMVDSRNKSRTAARYLGGVSLLDFNSPEYDNAEVPHGHHWSFVEMQPFSMAIGIDPKRVKGEILAYPENRSRTDIAVTGQSLQLPLLIEVVHIGPIPRSAWTRCLRIKPCLSFEKISL